MSAPLPPLRQAVEAYLAEGRARFHMPGHKGALPGFLKSAARYDVTELPGLDSLYEADGPIAETEARYAALYGSAGTFLSAGGATLCIQAMLALAVPPGGEVLCGRGVHTAALNAMALLDLRPVWLWPDIDNMSGLPASLTAPQVEAALREHPRAAAVYLTSPTYFGVLTDIEAVAKVCHQRGVPLLVDNAHGAHLKFLRPDRHPISLGADLCCDSLHKTLPVLTGGALLHVGNRRYLADAKRCMSLFGSTSPNYLILLSADGALPWLEGGAAADLARAAQRVAALERLALGRGLPLPPGPRDPLRLALGFAPAGLDAAGFRARLEEHGVEPEYLSDAFCVFLAGPHNTDEHFARLERLIAALPEAKEAPRAGEPPLPRPAAVLPPREALFAPREAVPPEQAEGRVCAGMVAPCPPGIPLAVAGELLDRNLCARLKKYGILSVDVLK